MPSSNLFHHQSKLLGNLAQYVHDLKRLEIRIWCGPGRVCYDVDLFSGVSFLEDVSQKPRRTREFAEAHRVEAQAVVDQFLARRGPGEGWSAAELAELLYCLRERPRAET